MSLRPIARPILVLLLACSEGWFSTISEGASVRFVAQELEGQRAVWTPREMVIREDEASEGEQVFVLENPTQRTHVFEAPGLVERTAGHTGVLTSQPLRVTVAPGETVEVLVMVPLPDREANPCGDGARCYDFFCPIHRGDLGEKGTIRVIRRNGK